MEASTTPALAALVERVLDAAAGRTPLCIQGRGTKDFYGGPRIGEALDVTPLTGIISHEPSELVITAWAGTPLAEIERTLAQAGQCLPFEPPHFGAGGTLGGCVAAGIAGPSRASAGSVRDYVLGATLLNGRAQLLRFGGQVVKNVAGYDISRALAGSLGVLGVITQLSLKVMPLARSEATLAFDLDAADALARLQRWAGEPLPLDASTWLRSTDGPMLYVRLRGATSAVESTAARLGGERIADSAATVFWQRCRDHQLPWFTGRATELDLWRVSVPQTAPTLPLPPSPSPSPLIEWHGGQRWYALPRAGASRVREIARAAGGHAVLFRRAGIEDPAAAAPIASFDEPAPGLMPIHRRLKDEFDPLRLFNRDRLYEGL